MNPGKPDLKTRSLCFAGLRAGNKPVEGKTQPSVNLSLWGKELIIPPEKKGKGIAQSLMEFFFFFFARHFYQWQKKCSFLWGEIVLLPAEVLP